MCARFLSHLLLVYIGRVHSEISGCTILLEVHPASAQNKSLISDTVWGEPCLRHFPYLVYPETLYQGDNALSTKPVMHY